MIFKQNIFAIILTILVSVCSCEERSLIDDSTVFRYNEHKNINSLDLFDQDIELSIEAFPNDRKNLLEIAHDVMKNDDNSGLIFATLNDIAVKKFLQKKIKFGEIYNLIFDNYHLIERKQIHSLKELNNNKEEINIFIEGK